MYWTTQFCWWWILKSQPKIDARATGTSSMSPLSTRRKDACVALSETRSVELETSPAEEGFSVVRRNTHTSEFNPCCNHRVQWVAGTHANKRHSMASMICIETSGEVERGHSGHARRGKVSVDRSAVKSSETNHHFIQLLLDYRFPCHHHHASPHLSSSLIPNPQTR